MSDSIHAITPPLITPSLRAAIYARLSDEDKDKTKSGDLSESIQNQITLATRFAREKDWLIVDVYSDDDWSGLDRERPEFNRLLRDCEQGRVDVVLCKDMSRFTRDKILTEEYLETRFAEWQVRFIGLTDGTDTADKSNKKSREINALVNQWYAEDISTKVRAAFKTKQELGCFIGSYPAYGYIKGATKGKLEIDPETAPVVRKIFALYLSGHGTHAIASLLNRAGIPNPTAKKESQYPNYKNPFKKNLHSIWNKTSIRRILRNQLYIGNMVQHKSEKLHFKTKRRKTMPPEDWDVVPDTHQPIIDSTTFNQVQAMLTARIRSTGQGLPHLFAGRVFCKDCGSGMVKSSHRSYSYLTCSRHRDGGSCTRHSIRLDTLTGVVTARLRVVLSGLMPERANLAARLAAREESSSHSRMLTTNLTNTQARIHAVLAGLKALYLEQSQGRLDSVTFEQLKGELLREKACLEAESERLNTDIADLGDPNSRQQFWADALEQLIACPSLSRELVNTMINYIEIGEKQNKCQEVVIHYNFRNG